MRCDVANRQNSSSRFCRNARLIFLVACFASISTALASPHYTDKQLDAFGARVGRILWVVSVNDRTPALLSAGAPTPPTFRVPPHASCETTELRARKTKTP